MAIFRGFTACPPMYVAAARTLFNEVVGALLGIPMVQAPSSPLLTLNMTGRMGKLDQK